MAPRRALELLRAGLAVLRVCSVPGNSDRRVFKIEVSKIHGKDQLRAVPGACTRLCLRGSASISPGADVSRERDGRRGAAAERAGGLLRPGHGLMAHS